MRTINNIRLFVNNTSKAKKVANNLEKELLKKNFNLVKNGDFELAISIGGDGTFLRMVKEFSFRTDIYYIGINAGTLGFLQEVDIDRCKDFVNNLNENNYNIEEIYTQDVKITTNSEIKNYNALNEIVVREKELNTLKAPIYIDNELLENYAGDGILVSTSTGSTAYNMSFGGPIIYNTLNTLVITPVAPLNNASYQNLLNSVIIPCDKVVSIKPNKDIFLSLDGENSTVNDCINIEVKIGNKKIKCIRMSDFHFVKVVNKKLLKE